MRKWEQSVGKSKTLKFELAKLKDRSLIEMSLTTIIMQFSVVSKT